MEIGSAGSVATVNARNVTNAKPLIAKCHSARRYDGSGSPTATSWVDKDQKSDDDDNDDDDVLSSVLLQVRHAYILPPATSAHGKKRQQ